MSVRDTGGILEPVWKKARRNQDMILQDLYSDAVDFNDDDDDDGDWEPVQGPTDVKSVGATSLDFENSGRVSGSCARDTTTDYNVNSQPEKKVSHHQDMYIYEDSDDNDSDWEPLQEPTAVAKWFCVNCTMVNFEDVVHCDICREHRESEILTHGFFASPLKGLPGNKLKVQGILKDSCLQDSTAVGFDERMLLHSEVEMKSHPHPERPDRLRAIAASLATAGIFPGKCFKIPPREITREELKTIHSLENIDAVELSSRMYASYFTSDTYANKHSALAARLAAGLCADLASTIFSGHVKNGFALVRPPGHHAGVNQAMGFCLHNNAAVAASAAQMAGAKRVLIVDWDVHHGNGTQEIFEQNKSVLYISLHRHEGGKFYPGTGAATEVGTMGAEGHCVNIPWSRGGVGDNDYIFAFQQVVLPIASEYAPDFTIISAGFDAARGDPLGGCDVTPAGFAQMTEMLTTLSRGKLLVILEGGYNLRSISSSATDVIKVLLGERHGRKVDNVVPTRAGLRSVLEVLKIQMIYWPTLESIFSDILSKWGVHVQERRKMSELPFRSNPCADPLVDNTVVLERSRLTSSTLMTQGRSHFLIHNAERQDKNKKTRGGDAEAAKDVAAKKPRMVSEAAVSSVASAFGSLAENNYSGDDLKLWSGKSESEFSFRMGLGEVFFHGLNTLSAKNAQISDLDKSVKKYRDSASSLKSQIKDIQKKSNDELQAKQKELEDLQAAFDKLTMEAKQAGEDHDNVVANMQGDIEGLKLGRKRELSEAYSQGFLGYLRAFLAGDPDYEWATHFAPSTPAYMLKFKAENEELITKERSALDAKINAELVQVAAAERAKLEGEKQDGEDATKEVSP